MQSFCYMAFTGSLCCRFYLWSYGFMSLLLLHVSFVTCNKNMFFLYLLVQEEDSLLQQEEHILLVQEEHICPAHKQQSSYEVWTQFDGDWTQCGRSLDDASTTFQRSFDNVWRTFG